VQFCLNYLLLRYNFIQLRVMDSEPIRRPEIWLQCTSGIFIVRTFMSKRVRRIRLRACPHAIGLHRCPPINRSICRTISA